MEDSIIERGRRIKLAAELGLVPSSRPRNHRLPRRKGKAGCGNSNKEEKATEDPVSATASVVGDEDEEEEVERRFGALQRLVPGGEDRGVDRLLEETAGYIEALQEQVSVLRALASFLDRLEKEKRMMGG